nr:hypothetical protein [uncultured bacterium]
MGEPYFQIKDKLRRHGIVAFSSNYALYGDMSQRVMSVIESMVPAVEVYSRGHLHDARFRKTAGSAFAVQEDPRQHPHRHVQSY